MTAKRFGVTPELPKGWVDIIDTDDNRTLCNIRIEYANNLIKLLNELHEENLSLKEHLKYQKGLAENFRELLGESNIEVIDLNEENEQLKQYIYDNLDEDICDVCSYQYLEKSKMDKYYVAKCKKGYDNCSKGTVIHCKDFKFKELQE